MQFTLQKNSTFAQILRHRKLHKCLYINTIDVIIVLLFSELRLNLAK